MESSNYEKTLDKKYGSYLDPKNKGVMTTIVEGTNKGKYFWKRKEIRNKRLLKEKGHRNEIYRR